MDTSENEWGANRSYSVGPPKILTAGIPLYIWYFVIAHYIRNVV